MVEGAVAANELGAKLGKWQFGNALNAVVNNWLIFIFYLL